MFAVFQSMTWRISLRVEVDQVDATMALTLVAAAHHRGRDELQRSGALQAATVTISW